MTNDVMTSTTADGHMTFAEAFLNQMDDIPRPEHTEDALALWRGVATSAMLSMGIPAPIATDLAVKHVSMDGKSVTIDTRALGEQTALLTAKHTASAS